MIKYQGVIKSCKCARPENIELCDSKKMVVKEGSLWKYLYKLVQFKAVMITFQKHFRDTLESITPITFTSCYGQNLGNSFKCLTREIFGKLSLDLHLCILPQITN